ncbi:MAG: diaminopimelate decarboxylase family protein [Solirubrobacteraceae bacterium]
MPAISPHDHGQGLRSMNQSVPTRESVTTVRGINDDGLEGLRALSRTGPPAFSQTEIENIDRLLPYLTYADQQLLISGIPVSRLWDGSHSMLLYLPDRALDNYWSIQSAFGRYFNVTVHCAVKACYVGRVLEHLNEAGAGVEIASELEWRLVRRLGFPASRTVVNGMSPPVHHLQRLLAEDELLIDVDSDEELEHLEWQAARSGVRPRVMVRVNPLPPDGFFSERSKLGVGFEEALLLLEKLAQSQHLQLAGLHAHQLARCADPARFGLMVRHLAELQQAFTTLTGTEMGLLDLGGGVETRYLLERAGHPIDEFAAEARDALAGVDNVQIMLEPGRYIFGDAALALSRVRGTKRKDGYDWLIAEVGSNLLPPTSDRAYPALPLRIAEGQVWNRYQVADPTPTPARLCLDAMLPADAPEHGIVMLGCGAYTAVRASLWSNDLPDIAVLSGGRVEMVFDRRSQDTAFAALYGVNLEGVV